MSGKPCINKDRTKFTEEIIDEFYELGFIDTDQMWKLREACDIWNKAQQICRSNLKKISHL